MITKQLATVLPIFLQLLIVKTTPENLLVLNKKYRTV
ncbi:hypothetical protein ACVW2L_003677 [Mucilaginibacter sp. HD30]